MDRESPVQRSAPSAASLSDEEAGRLRGELEKAVGNLCPRALADRREDLVQSAMLKVTRILARSPPDRELAASYLWRTAYSALIDELRRQRRRGEVPLEAAVAAERANPLPGPRAVSRGREILRAVQACLEVLIAPRRKAVILYLQGETADEVAELLGWKRKRVHNLTYRGLADLRRCLAGKGVEP